MNNPFPTALQLRSELAVERLLAEQAADTATFLVIVQAAQKAVAGLTFPCGSPAHRYDLDAILSTLSDWQIPRDPDHLREYAEDAVLTVLGGV